MKSIEDLVVEIKSLSDRQKATFRLILELMDFQHDVLPWYRRYDMSAIKKAALFEGN